MISDHTVNSLCKFIQNVRKHNLTKSQQTALSRHLIDTVGCAMGAIHSMPAEIARKLASGAQVSKGCTVFSMEKATTPEYAAFANTAMVRYMDFNDTGNGGHPSDIVPAILALAEMNKVSGESTAKAIFAVYETYAAIRRGGLYGNLLRKKHIDQIYAIIAGAVGCSVVLNLDLEQSANAIALAITPNIPMRAARTGKISYWKSTATAHASMMSVMASRLSSFGMTGPEKPFEGSGGFYQMFDLEPLNLNNIGEPYKEMSALESTGFKTFPANYNAQGPAQAVIMLKEKAKLEEIERVLVSLHWGGWHSQGGGAGDKYEKWNPTTREEAENSMAYVVAVSLLDGNLSYESFDSVRVNDEKIKSIMQKIEVCEDPELTEKHKGVLPSWPSKCEIFLKNGEHFTEEISSPKGHPLNPMTNSEIEQKFTKLTDNIFPDDKIIELLNDLWAFTELNDISKLMKKFRII